MDIEFARTFLEIVSTGNFQRAAERLNVAQTTVSARVRTLEQQLGRALFVRSKAGASLTPAGEQFLRYAPTLVQLWQRARQQVAVPSGHRSMLTIGSELNLWNPFLLEWVIWMRRALPDVALRVHVDVPQDLINLVAAGAVDIALMYAPQQKPGLKIDLLLEEKLVLMTTSPDARNFEDVGYVYVDWGPEFALQHGMALPDVAPGLVIGLGPLALWYVLKSGGSGYFRYSAAKQYLAEGRLHVVPNMPQFAYPVYVVYSANLGADLLNSSLAGLREITRSHT